MLGDPRILFAAQSSLTAAFLVAELAAGQLPKRPPSPVGEGDQVVWC
ncbi:MAG: hypothetical protein ACLPVY_08795 [Acidimicrobiia bacterium]